MRKVYAIILTIGFMLPLFQNCGMSASTQSGGLYVGVDTPDCLATVVDCGPKPEYLEITIDLSNPSVFPASNNKFTVYGRCNEGNYEKTSIRYTIYEATDLETPKAQLTKTTGDSTKGFCNNGKYSQQIDINSGYSTNTAYLLKVEILGYDPETDALVQNQQTNGSATIDFSKE